MPEEIQLPLMGGCQCGRLRYKISEAPVMVYACHCTNCQRIAGSAFSLPITVKEDSLIFIEGEPAKAEWQSESGNDRFGFYCSDCGVRIAHGQTPPSGILSVRGPTLDNTGWIRPFGHIWTRSSQAWFQFQEHEITHDTQPTDYVPIIQRFQEAVRFRDPLNPIP